MKTIDLLYDKTIEKGELKKLISFVSSDIIKFELMDSQIRFYLEDTSDENAVQEKYERLVSKYCHPRDNEDIYFINEKRNKGFTSFDQIMEAGLVKKYGDGLFGLHSNAIKLFHFFSTTFRNFAMEVGAEEKIYPTLLEVKSYERTGYLKSSPQYATFCCDVIEDTDCIGKLNEEVNKRNTSTLLSEPKFALSPSACFHTYMEYENKKLNGNKTVTFTQKVFRNEGRFNWDEFGRMRDYHVREIVFLGNDSYVTEQRKKFMEKTAKFMEHLGISGDIVSSSDPFIAPKMQRLKKLQMYEKNKYEARIRIDENISIACASFNFHGVSFTRPFMIQIQDTERPVTGCIGFGIERWVLSFLSQFGVNKEFWPDTILQFVNKYK